MNCMIISVLVKFAREEDERDRDSKCKLTFYVNVNVSSKCISLHFNENIFLVLQERLPDMTFLSSKETTSLIDPKEP